MYYVIVFCFFVQAEDGIRYLVRSRGLGDVYKRQRIDRERLLGDRKRGGNWKIRAEAGKVFNRTWFKICLLYTSDAADERSSVDLGGRRIIKKKTK